MSKKTVRQSKIQRNVQSSKKKKISRGRVFVRFTPLCATKQQIRGKWNTQSVNKPEK